MASSLYVKSIVKHLANGTLDENLCRVCLHPVDPDFTQNYVNTFTRIYTEHKEFCIADVLEKMCNIEVNSIKNSIVCSTCLNNAKIAYDFYIKCTDSTAILNFYANELLNQCSDLNPDEQTESLCFQLPMLLLEEKDDFDEIEHSPGNKIDEVTVNNDTNCIIKTEEGLFKIQWNEEEEEGEESDGQEVVLKKRKYPSNVRRNRSTMPYKDCLKCSVQYRFASKLIQHMKEAHNLSTFLCKECDTIVTSEDSARHLQMHLECYICSTCGASFKKRRSMVEHLLKHSEPSSQGKFHICEYCGMYFLNMPKYNDHLEKCHLKKYTCYYCGKLYKSSISFEAHIKKHEMQEETVDQEFACDTCPQKFRNAHALSRHVDALHDSARPFRCARCDMRFRSQAMLDSHTKTHVRNHVCDVCNSRFVDARNLMWHKRLHTDDRPFKCDQCDRAFVSLNRRNQHRLCAHTAPTKRCPLCPALFHLTSMVNTHLKKVHLRAHKRNNRSSKYKDANWKANVVPIQDLSVSIQNDLLEFQPTVVEE